MNSCMIAIEANPAKTKATFLKGDSILRLSGMSAINTINTNVPAAIQFSESVVREVD